MYAVDRDGNDVARYAAAGILNRIRDITIFLNPSDASYTRFGTNAAPDKVNWSGADESELMYVETYMGRVRAELRSPDASGNPYLVYALLIFAGLEGIREKLPLPKEMSEDSLPLPRSRKEAVKIAGESSFVKQIIPESLLWEYLRK